MGGIDFINADPAFCDFQAPRSRHPDDRIPGDAGQDAAVQHRGDEFVADDEEDVHRADFFDIFQLDAIEPHHLGVSLLVGKFGGVEAGGVVAGCFGLADAAPDGPHILGGDPDLDRVEALGIVGPHRREDDEEPVRVRCAQTDIGIGGDDGGADVERCPRRARNPAFFDLEQLDQGAEDETLVKGRDAEPVRRAAEAADIVLRAEELNRTALGAVSLQALEDGLAVMQRHHRRLHHHRAIGLDTGVVPAFFRIVVHIEHVIREFGPEPQRRFIRVILQALRLFECYFHHDSLPNVSDVDILRPVLKM